MKTNFSTIVASLWMSRKRHQVCQRPGRYPRTDSRSVSFFPETYTHPRKNVLCIPAGHSLECFFTFFSVKHKRGFFTIMTRVGENTTMIPQSQPTRNAAILYYYYYFLHFYFLFFPGFGACVLRHVLAPYEYNSYQLSFFTRLAIV